ncbi:hypothetical protein MAC_03467 [Metarhizium acridum CQMa 102]|uniref:Uncharacterized protein n=1 Tax=Metarhizium acridum (strain CQMa 102) TaxID=655827 RepID=E9E0R9_METAQ|nr:uncharacterized protein MAC_03467 [Metarhizium acridum CQMa 102]EFY90473.1 hypothetical protein MAC_03467 [Metarhizium acridum CQMa 102]
MSPKAPVAHTDKAPYFSKFSSTAMNTVDQCPVQEDPGFLWQHQALNRPKINDIAGKQQEKKPGQAKHRLPNLTMSAQASPKKASDELPILLNARYSKDNYREDRLTNITNIRKDQCRPRPSSVSTCGDLEGPYRVTPNKSHLPVNDEHHETIPQPEEFFGANAYDGGFARRSGSRTSNISRKRSSVNKHRSQPEPGRKKMLMQQVAQYWNECINIAEEERAQARLEIDQLREDLRRQYAKLTEARHQLDNEQAGRKDTEQKLKHSEEKVAEALLENSTLSQKLSTMQEELRSTKERDVVLAEKSRTYRTKLNEAILEQQRLFLQAKEFYHDSIQKLRQENETRVAETKAIETALTNSHEKREKMRHCLDELRSGLEKEVEARGEEITRLRERISAQEQALCTERQISSDLRNQIMSVKPLQSDEVQDLVNTVKSLHESISTNAVDQTQQLELSESVCRRLQNLEVLVKGLASNASKEIGIASLVEGLHELVSTDVFSALSDIGGAQSCTYETLVGIRNDCQAELKFMRTALSDLTKQQTSMQDQFAAEIYDSIRKLDTVHGDVTLNRELCQHIGEEMTTWFTKERDVINAERDSLKKDVVRLLNEGNDRTEDLEKIVIASGHTCLSKLDSLNTAVATRDDETKAALQQIRDRVQSLLDKNLHLETSNAGYDPKDTQRILASLEGLVVSISEHLGQSGARVANQGKPSQHDEQDDAAVTLQDKISQLEKEVSKTTDLQKRWHSDIQIVDSIRSKLKILQQLPSQIDGCSEQLAKFSRVSSMLDSASTDLAKQETWVKQQLGINLPQINSNVVTPPRAADQLKPSQLMDPNDRYNQPENSNNDREMSTESDEIRTTQNSNSEFGQKRVQVQSPTEAQSPSSPPSIEQEQKRRRIPMAVRPILKANSLSLSQESIVVQHQSNETETELGPILESRKTTTTISSASAASQKIIADISSGFITDKSEETFFNLPRVTDFQPQLKVVPSQVISQKRKFKLDDGECPKLKRVKLISGLENKLSIESQAMSLSKDKDLEGTKSQPKLGQTQDRKLYSDPDTIHGGGIKLQQASQ